MGKYKDQDNKFLLRVAYKTMKKLSLLCPRKEEVGSSTALAGRQVP